MPMGGSPAERHPTPQREEPEYLAGLDHVLPEGLGSDCLAAESPDRLSQLNRRIAFYMASVDK